MGCCVLQDSAPVCHSYFTELFHGFLFSLFSRPVCVPSQCKGFFLGLAECDFFLWTQVYCFFVSFDFFIQKNSFRHHQCLFFNHQEVYLPFFCPQIRPNCASWMASVAKARGAGATFASVCPISCSWIPKLFIFRNCEVMVHVLKNNWSSVWTVFSTANDGTIFIASDDFLLAPMIVPRTLSDRHRWASSLPDNHGLRQYAAVLRRTVHWCVAMMWKCEVSGASLPQTPTLRAGPRVLCFFPASRPQGAPPAATPQRIAGLASHATPAFAEVRHGPHQKSFLD